VDILSTRLGGKLLEEEKTKESIRNILYDMECDDPAHAIENDDLEKAVNRISLLIETMLRQERLKKENQR